MPTLLRDPHFVLERYAAPAFIRLARTAEPLGSHDQVVSSLQGCRAALQASDHIEHGILLDWRLAPAVLTVPSLEQAIVRDVEAFAAPFARKAVLLLAAATSEAATWSRTRLQIFHDEEAAMVHVGTP